MTPALPDSSQITARPFSPTLLAPDFAPPAGMPLPEEQQVVDWVHDAFAITFQRAPSSRPAEINLRRGLEAIVRHVARVAPPLGEPTGTVAGRGPELSAADLRNILEALDACLSLFDRNDNRLNTAQRRIQILVRACRRNAREAFQASNRAAALPDLRAS